MTPIHQEKHAGFNVSIYIDEGPFNPMKDCDLLGEYVCFHRDYDLGQEHDFRDPQEAFDHYGAPGEYMSWPLYLMDHSGLSIRMDSSEFGACDPQGWDWGQVGQVFVNVDKATEEFGKDCRDKVLKCIQGEVNTYDMYLRGDVYYYTVASHRNPGDILDSCGSIFGFEYCLEEARESAKLQRKEQMEAHTEQVKAYIRHGVPLGHRKACEVP